ncbi:nucleotidyltransferase family protein [Jannaschia sp. W003]|uniref:nucleotidyltransferase family protein n=1 Tax=Jannaschia sp. W003 TaxID=2867012 RepID=UPI0021A36025|nr:nucleotidyltransferase family protein [Jannaschia sp. W003]UWQ21615.1 nucleotidyltransferase family protein [Jannaschia sp. W003]
MIAAMVFAAGLGTRMRPLTDDRPKAMVAVAGRPLIDHALEQVEGCAPVVVNAHHHAAALRAHLADRAGVTLVEERPLLLETGGGLRNALPHLGGGPVLTMNADNVWTGPRAAATLRAAWDPGAMDGLLLLGPIRGRAEAGRWKMALDGEGRIALAEEGLDYLGAGIVKTDGMGAMPDGPFSLRELWLPMIERGRLHGVVHPGGWADVGRPENIAAAEALLAGAPA